jgi:large subunit ribosomal protein L19
MDVSSLVELKKNRKIPDIVPGDTVKVSARIVEAGKERIQVFQGVVIKVRRGGAGASFTVRHVAYGIGVERTFPLYSPLVEKVQVVRHGKVRRSRLYYLRGLSGKAARRKIKRVERKAEEISEELLEAEPEEELLPEDVVVEEAEAEAEEGAEAAVEEKAEAAVEEEAVAEVTEEKAEAVTEEEAVAEVTEEKAEAAAEEEAVAGVTEEKVEAAAEEEKAPEEAQEPEAILEAEQPQAEEEKAAADEQPEEEPVMEKEGEAEPAAESSEDSEEEKS